MPFMTNGKRDYKKEANWEHTKARHRLKDRVERVQARRLIEKQVGNLPTSEQVDHIRPIIEGGGNNRSNLRVVTARTNLEKEAHRKQGK